jgi:2-dehydro-3-deoxyphosphogluconate aldolase/(4S)-4-hydroxy-2-oxoglutarate aldolase
VNEILRKIGDMGIVPVVKIDNAKDAEPLGRALIEGGLPVAEITFRTEAAQKAIENISFKLPQILVGAGTVLNTDQVKRAVAAGARFIVSPGFNASVVEYCIKNDIPVTPGCSNPTDIEMALAYGLEVVKFFPAEAFGGLNTIKAVSAPYGTLKFIPTGGISEKNIKEYLAFNKILACGGSWMVKDELIKAGKFDEIERLTREAVGIMLGFDLAHVGINTDSAESSIKMASRLSRIFNMPLKEGSSSNFAGAAIEVNKGKGLGANGHIAIKTNSIQRAIAYLERNGMEVDMSTAKGPADAIVAVYLKEEFGGFAVHLLQNK